MLFLKLAIINNKNTHLVVLQQHNVNHPVKVKNGEKQNDKMIK
jgi:hypothetical protein